MTGKNPFPELKRAHPLIWDRLAWLINDLHTVPAWGFDDEADFEYFVRGLQVHWPPKPADPKKAPIPSSLRWEVFKRDDFRCRGCGSRDNLRADHIIPESQRGPTELSNLQTLCATCNSRKGSRHVGLKRL